MTIHARLITLAIAGLCASGAVGCEKSGVQAARQNTSDPTSKQILSMDDRDFLIGAEKAGIRQRTLAQQALQKSNNNEVREFARHVITDRSQALSELKRVMDAKQMKEQAALAVEVQMTAEARLQGLSNAAFDHEFVSLMTAEQQETLAGFRTAAETAADPEIRNYAERILPSLQTDYDKAADLEKRLAAKTPQ